MVLRAHLEASALRPHDLTWTAFNVLAILRHQGTAQIGQVARQLGASAGTLTGVAKNLEQRGLLQRNPHPSDRRHVLMCLTEEGAALAEGLSFSYLAEAEFVTSCFSDDDATLLSELLTSLTAHVVATSQQRCVVMHEYSDLPPRRSRRKRAHEKPSAELDD
ncbi:MarR family transcriptional regulator [Nocardia sp. NRRL S-836]|uniref:MarR family transcriptional regulator n=1 Tax=Nocardia sp. NRRL S-836 TaxID=1519492 RepID=UPI0009E679D8|nr:MarR family transcriptional regulator [Nocardia sp. NRRL S-836]